MLRQHIGEAIQQLRRAKWLPENGIEQLWPDDRRCETGDENERNVRRNSSDFGRHLFAIHCRHGSVERDQIPLRLPKNAQSFLARLCCVDSIARVLQNSLEGKN